MIIKTQNFSVEEIVHTESYLSNLTPEEFLCAGMLIGTLETVRDYLASIVKHPVPIKITSGLRRLLHNIELYKKLYPNQELPKAAFTSNHVWRVENHLVRCACDFKTINYSTIDSFNLLKPWWTGELYYNKKEDIIHVGYQGKTLKQPWVQ